MTAVAERAPGAPGPPTAPRVRGGRPVMVQGVVAAGVPTILTGAHAAWYGQWIVDDAGLTFAYARSLATGAGAVLQPGADPVEGYSNPAWLAILVVGRELGLFDHGAWFGVPDLVLFPKVIALLCCFGIFACMYAVAAAVSLRPVAITLVAGTVTAAVPSFVIWTTSGLENALFALAVVALATTLARAVVAGRLLDTRTALACGALAAVAALTRPDGVIYVAAYPLAAALFAGESSIRRTVRSSLASVAAFAVPVGVYLAWRIVTFGDVLPNTARAKEQGLPTAEGLGKPAALIGYTGWLTTVLAVAVVAALLSRRSSARTAVAVLLIPMGLAVAAYAVLIPDWMGQHRFATPVWPLAAMAVTLAAAQVLPEASDRSRFVATTAATLAAALTLSGFAASATAFRTAPTAHICYVAQGTGYAINGYADILGIRDGSLLAVDGGGSSLTTRLRFVDLSGLADARIAGFWQADDMAGLRDHVFDEVRPTFIKIWYGWAETGRTGLLDDPRLARDYVLLWSARPDGGDWVRRDAVPDAATLVEAQQRGSEVAAFLDRTYDPTVPPVWTCGEALRPTPFGARPSLTRP